MGTPILINGYRVLVQFTAQPGGRPWSTKFDYVETTSVIPTPTEVASEFRDQFEAAVDLEGTGITASFGAGSVIENYRCYRLVDPLQGADVPPLDDTFGTSAGYLPAECAAVTSLRTALLGRRYRGRQYWGALAPGAVPSAGGVLGTAVRDALVGLVQSMMTLPVGAGANLRMAVISGQGLDIPRPPGMATEVTSVLCDQFPDTQRRRGAR